MCCACVELYFFGCVAFYCMFYGWLMAFSYCDGLTQCRSKFDLSNESEKKKREKKCETIGNSEHVWNWRTNRKTDFPHFIVAFLFRQLRLGYCFPSFLLRLPSHSSLRNFSIHFSRSLFLLQIFFSRRVDLQKKEKRSISIAANLRISRASIKTKGIPFIRSMILPYVRTGNTEDEGER